MRESIIIILFTLIFSSCIDKKQPENVITEIDRLRIENDSLKKIISEINGKYVFDSISVRQVIDSDNSYKLNSLYKTKLYFIGYNKNDNTYMAVMDSIRNDTLELNENGYPYSKVLQKKENIILIELNAENKFGKNFQATFMDKIQTRK